MESAKNAINSATSAVTNALHGNKQESDNVNTADTTASHHHDTTTSHHHDTTSANTGSSNDSPATSQGSRTTDAGAHDGVSRSAPDSGTGSELEQTLSGPRDPAVQGEEHPKMSGDGAPGSHSAVFGLTPDGKKIDDTSSGQQAPVQSSTSGGSSAERTTSESAGAGRTTSEAA